METRLPRFFLTLMSMALVCTASTGSLSAAKVTLTEAFLNDPDDIAVGKKLFLKPCARCHGQRAYPEQTAQEPDGLRYEQGLHQLGCRNG